MGRPHSGQVGNVDGEAFIGVQTVAMGGHATYLGTV